MRCPPIAIGKPFQEGGADEVPHRPAEEGLGIIELVVAREGPLERQLSEDRRTEHTIRTPRPSEAAFDHRRVPFEDPGRRLGDDRAH
jgi:hypothetical protein